MNGVPLMVVAKILGHADTRMVEKHYGQLAPSFIADAIKAGAPRYRVREASSAAAIPPLSGQTGPPHARRKVGIAGANPAIEESWRLGRAGSARTGACLNPGGKPRNRPPLASRRDHRANLLGGSAPMVHRRCCANARRNLRGRRFRTDLKTPTPWQRSAKLRTRAGST
jgi:hypothetical protein